MARTYTPNLNLILPQANEPIRVQDFQTNFSLIDTAVHGVETSQSSMGNSMVKNIRLLQSDTTWSKIWTKLNAMNTGETAPFYCSTEPASILSDGFLTSFICGTITRPTSDTFSIIAKFGKATLYAIHINDATSTSPGTFSIRNYGGLVATKVFTDPESRNERTLVIPSSFRGEIHGIGVSITRCFAIIVMATSSGDVTFMEMVKGSGVTIEVPTTNGQSNGTKIPNRLKITTSASGTMNFFITSSTYERLDGVGFP